ncbi:uncharacterized protein TNCV_1229041 [Trichonephila clavipes]|nr:uncharacterized protein TNCV_1229041 [Trichonephila clavipes]
MSPNHAYRLSYDIVKVWYRKFKNNDYDIREAEHSAWLNNFGEKHSLQSYNLNVTNPGQSITDKKGLKLFSTTCLKEATVGNAVKGLKECGIEPHNPLAVSEHVFVASKTTDHVVVGNETENNSANIQTLVVENQRINPPEETELMANADSDTPKKPVNVFDPKPLSKTTQWEEKSKKKKN